MNKNWSAYLAELIGTFVVVLVAAGAVCANRAAVQSGMEASPGGRVIVALAYGLIYAAVLTATLPLSEGFLNPAVTLTLWVFKRLDGVRTTGLIAVQLLGAVLAGGLIRAVFPLTVLDGARMGTPHVNAQAFGAFDPGDIGRTMLIEGGLIEFALTLALTFVIFGTLIDPRGQRWVGVWGKRLAGLWAGLTVIAATLVAYPMTGAALNPARWFGPWVWELTIASLASNTSRDHVVFWFGPIAGALVAGGLYVYLILPKEAEAAAPVIPPAGSRTSTGASATLFRSRK